MNATTTTPNTSRTALEIVSVMPGAHVVRVGTRQLAVGFPEEIVKAWMKAGVAPDAWLIPDVRTAHGMVQWALEFPLYHALFVRGTFGRQERIPVVVHRAQWTDVLDYLRLTLLGLTRDEMVRAGLDAATAETLSREATFLALKHADGRVAAIEDFLEPHFFDHEGTARLGELTVKSHGGNTWSFHAGDDRVEEFHLEVPDTQLPPYAASLPPATTPVLPQPFELVMLGASNGFDPANACSNLVVQSNGRFVLVDAGPYIRTTLRHAGVGLNQVGALVITHAHEDHAVGLSALLETRHRIRLFISQENAVIMRRKLAILNPAVQSPATLLDDAFDVTLIQPGTETSWAGITLRFHHTFHSIPCTGVEFSVSSADGGTTRRILVAGDSDSRAHLEAAALKGAIPADRLAALRALYAWDGDLVVADAGEGAIHGAPADFADSPARQVVYCHTGKLKDGDAHRFTLARAGYRYTVIPESSRPSATERALAQRALATAFPSADADELMVLLDAATAASVNPGQVVVRQGDTSRELYVVVSGELAALRDDAGRPVALAHIDAGEVFGERAQVSGAPRAATVTAVSSARLVVIPARVFARFCEGARLPASLPDLWRKRQALDAIRLLDGASVTTKNQLAAHATWKTVEPGSTLIREASSSSTVYVLVRGRVQVYKGDGPLLVGGTPVIVDPGTLIGETAPFLDRPRNASIVTLDACEVLAIRGKDFRRLVERSPQLFCHVSRTVAQRAAA